MKRKKFVALVLAGAMVLPLVACGGGGSDGGGGSSGSGGTINVFAFTDEVPNMLNRYLELNPDFDEQWDFNITTIATTEGAYQPALDQALVAGGNDAPDLYMAEEAFVLKYTQADMAEFAATYKDLGIDVDSLVSEAQIAQYTIDIGSREDEIVGLGFQATGSAVIYRRSIAQAVWGTDDPAEVKTHLGSSWEDFLDVGDEIKAQGYKLLSGGGDLWQAVRNTGEIPWVVDGALQIDPNKEAYMDYSKVLFENDLTNRTLAWQDAWFADMSNADRDNQVFCFLGPAWLINYVMVGNSGGNAVGEGTYGDWAVTESPVGFYWGGTWVLANKAVVGSDKQEAVADLVEWITLDSSDDGLQYKWANGTLYEDSNIKDTVAAAAVMDRSNGELDFIGGQNMFEVFVPANQYANGTGSSPYDETINQFFSDQATEYAEGRKSRDQAIQDFKQQVADNLAVSID